MRKIIAFSAFVVFSLSLVVFSAAASVPDFYFTYIDAADGLSHRIDSSSGSLVLPSGDSIDMVDPYLHVPFTALSSVDSDIAYLSIDLTLDLSSSISYGHDLNNGVHFSQLKSLPFYGDDGRLFNVPCTVSYRVGDQVYNKDQFSVFVNNLYNDYMDNDSVISPFNYTQIFTLQGLSDHLDDFSLVREIRLPSGDWAEPITLRVSYDLQVVPLPVVDGLSSAFSGIISAASSLFDFAHGTVGVYWVLGISVSFVLVSIVIIRRFVLR